MIEEIAYEKAKFSKINLTADEEINHMIISDQAIDKKRY